MLRFINQSVGEGLKKKHLLLNILSFMVYNHTIIAPPFVLWEKYYKNNHEKL